MTLLDQFKEWLETIDNTNLMVFVDESRNTIVLVDVKNPKGAEKAAFILPEIK